MSRTRERNEVPYPLMRRITRWNWKRSAVVGFIALASCTPDVVPVDPGATQATRGTKLPALFGRYFFADYCTGWVKSLKMQNGVATDVLDHTAQFGIPGNITSFGEDGRGELYITASGAVYRIAPQ